MYAAFNDSLPPYTHTHTIVTVEVSSDDSDSFSEQTIKSRRLRNVVARLTHTGNQALTVKMMMSS